MTPNLNSNPLAALTNGAASTTIGAGVAADTPAARPGDVADKDKSETGFLDVLQLYSVTSSMDIENIPGLGQAQGALLPALETPGTVLGGLPESEQALVSVALPVTVPDAQLLSAGTKTGSTAPQGGNFLPPSDVRSQPAISAGGEGHLTKSGLLQTAPSQTSGGLAAAWELNGPPVSGEATSKAKQLQPRFINSLPDAVLPDPKPARVGISGAMTMTQESAGPQSLQPLPQWSNPPSIPVGAGNAATLTQAMADVTALVAEGDGANAESMRINTVAPASERLSHQPIVPAMPLTRLAGSPGWDQGLGQRILWMVDNGLKQAELRLDPPHLGSINIRITMQDDQAQLMFQVAHPAAREALESALPKLREMFNQQGLELGDTDVSDHKDPSADERGQQGEQLSNSATLADRMQIGGDEESGGETATTSIRDDRIAGHAYVDEFV